MKTPCLPLLLAALALVGPGLFGCTPKPSWSTPVSGLAPVLLSVWGNSPTDVWAVGGTCDQTKKCADTSKSIVLHFDGKSWTEKPTGVSAVLWWVYGFGRDDVWIVGEQGTILHWDGTSFTKVPSPAAATDKLFGIWGATSRDLWAVGGNPDSSSVVLRWDGMAWNKSLDAPPILDERMFKGTWYKVWGSSPTDVWLVGQHGFVVHFDGRNFARADLSKVGVTSQQGLFTAAGHGADDVYVVGGDPAHGIALHYDGKTWTTVAGLDTTQTQLLTGVYETAAGDVAITGLGGAKFIGRAGAFRNDSNYAPLDDLHAVWMDAPDDVFAAGGNFYALSNGIVAHFGQLVSSTRN